MTEATTKLKTRTQTATQKTKSGREALVSRAAIRRLSLLGKAKAIDAVYGVQGAAC